MTDRASEPAADNGETKRAPLDESSKANSSSEQRPSSRTGENADHRSSPSSQHRRSPTSYHPPPPADMPGLAKNPNMNPANRPPSTTSVHSNNSGGTRTTATSRRGGRTRSRSPPAMSNRASLSSHDSRGYPPPIDGGDSNPSSAAAAAAAAAKALSSNPGGQSWSDRGSFRGDDRHRGGSPGDEPSKFPGYDSHFQGSRSWPAEDHDRPRRSGSYGHSQSIHRLPGGSGGGSGDLYGGRSYGSEHPYRGSRSGSNGMHYDERPPDDRRYGDRRGGPYDPDMRKRGRSMSPSTDRYGNPYPYRGSERGGMAPAEGARSSPKGRPPSRQGGGGMSRVIGTATPIHVPRAAEAPPPSRHSRSGTPASVFRGRPGSDGPPSSRREERGAGPSASQEDSPQKILLSLRTPTTSFDEKQPAKETKDADLPPSPDEPPQIQHSHHQQSSDFFEPSRSPKPGSIEMAPSFNLFNQSFDSFGDTFNVVGNLDASLQSASFGAGPTASGEFGSGQALQRSLSGGNYTQQLLGGSGSGALTFGMSPVNSFGNGPSQSSSRRGTIMLGGQDHRSASPTQVLGMYHSYSGGGSHGMLRSNNSMGPLEDSHLRLSAGSFGAAPSLSHNYTRSFGAEGSVMSYNGRMAHSHEAGESGQIFYIFLRKHKAAFNQCTFLLPGLKAALLEAPDKPGELGDPMDPMKQSMSHGMYPEPSPQETAIARRRVTSAVCAFGGSQNTDHSQQNSASGQSIFREKEDTPTVTPSSSSNAPSGSRFQSRAKMKYDEVMPTRYYENENRLSWEFEENPPVETHADENSDSRKQESSKKEQSSSGTNTNETSQAAENSSGEKEDKKAKAEDNTPPTPSTPSKSSGDKDDASKTGESVNSPSGASDQPKMRYRCKLCGQPKTNHVCPFMQSLARSIGVMVYPSVNAFTAAEPGIVAPPLSEMNNFVGNDDASVAESTRSSPDRRSSRMAGPGANGSTQVTPESRHSKRGLTSPTSTLSTPSRTPQRPRTPGSGERGRPPPMAARTPGSASSRRSRKRRHGQMESPGDNDQGDLLFVEPMELKQEQFRMVTPSKSALSSDAYTYPALPLPYAQRKRLSDNLFSLSQKVPQLTKECSAVLREAREKDQWDLAVAELMTQVVVVIHCHEGDARFDGLRQYLLTLGIAC